MLTIYNKGKREWNLGDIKINPGKAVELENDRAEKLLNDYPSDFIRGGLGGESKSARQLKKENERLKAELEAMKTKKSTRKKSEPKKAEPEEDN